MIRACDLNQKSKQALDALAKDHVDFEATMANVTREHEAGDGRSSLRRGNINF